jgi:hypothetical protein
MSNLYYIGIYHFDEGETDCINNNTNLVKDNFKSFFCCKKINDKEYIIVEIIFIERYCIEKIKIGDTINISCDMITYSIFSDGKEIYSGVENVNVIEIEKFNCFYDYSVNDLINNLYVKLKKYDKLIGSNPYSQIYEVINKYYEEE